VSWGAEELVAYSEPVFPASQKSIHKQVQSSRIRLWTPLTMKISYMVDNPTQSNRKVTLIRRCFPPCAAIPKVAPYRAHRNQMTMPHSISALLTRNLQEVFGENDPARRRAAVDELWTEDGVFYDPNKGVYRGRDEIDRIAGAIRATHPDFRYQPIAAPEEVGNGGRVQWVSGRPGDAPSYAGTDFIVARDGQIAALYLFFDKLP
jgi:hypothetical protein